jgi:uncharacterized protein
LSIIFLEKGINTSPWNPKAKLARYVYLYIAPTPLCGLGLFSARSWTAGDTVLRVHDPHYLSQARPYAQLHAMGYAYSELFQIGPDLFIPPYGALDDFTNHSCDPNCGLRVDSSGFTMIALKDIAAHHELTYDYSTHQEHPHDHMICSCGAASCRGVIGSFSTLDPELRRHYLQLDIVAGFAKAQAIQARVG